MKLPFRKEKELYSSLYQILGFYPGNIRFYKQALLHKSSSVKSEQGKWINNERLEFLGDAILDAIVGDIVFRRFEGKKEGFLTNARSKIVQRETLNKVAMEIGLHKLIKYSVHSNNAHNSNMCGNAFEALIGAIYLDRGYSCCMHFMKERILEKYISVDSIAYKEVNFKSKLIEWTQKNRISISFELLEQATESDGTPTFSTQVSLEGIKCGSGKGYSKKESQQTAAKETLEMLKRTGFTHKVLETRDQRLAAATQTGTNAQDAAEAASPAESDTPTTESAETVAALPAQPAPAATQSVPVKPAPDAVSERKLSKEEIVEAAERAAFES